MIFISKVKIFIKKHAYEDINPITRYIHASAAWILSDVSIETVINKYIKHFSMISFVLDVLIFLIIESNTIIRIIQIF